ncbi:uncharacterized protein LOC142330107 [Lycorma delicatula]|uniref:uncharacterized protein LOC142330107 n=1 Tax=Lycorma delicatula TaxID=130591 RepID=UPI003F512F54
MKLNICRYELPATESTSANNIIETRHTYNDVNYTNAEYEYEFLASQDKMFGDRNEVGKLEMALFPSYVPVHISPYELMLQGDKFGNGNLIGSAYDSLVLLPRSYSSPDELQVRDNVTGSGNTVVEVPILSILF